MPKEKLFSITLADCEVDTFRSGGPGGQHQNKTETGVRIRHKASGAVGESREHKSQLQNKKAAFSRMTKHPKFTVWLNKKIYESGKSTEQKIQEDMKPWNLKIEEFRDDEWHVTH